MPLESCVDERIVGQWEGWGGDIPLSHPSKRRSQDARVTLPLQRLALAFESCDYLRKWPHLACLGVGQRPISVNAPTMIHVQLLSLVE
jgi:hypothetical protein